jgi:hypothetical protein
MQLSLSFSLSPSLPIFLSLTSKQGAHNLFTDQREERKREGEREREKEGGRERESEKEREREREM